MKRFTDRRTAGQELAERLAHYLDQPDVLVLGLPRGGVPVAFEVARVLQAPLDVMVVRKLGAPGQPELAVGAIASGDVTLLNEAIPAWFRDASDIERTAEAERIELERRERIYRGEHAPLDARNRTIILVDDGAATGATMRAAVRAVRKLNAKRVVVALPVASLEAVELLRSEADEVVCLGAPLGFYSVGQWYDEFPQLTDEEVTDLLMRANSHAARANHHTNSPAANRSSRAK
jgi:putative phosphoribosyl transferase